MKSKLQDLISNVSCNPQDHVEQDVHADDVNGSPNNIIDNNNNSKNICMTSSEESTFDNDEIHLEGCAASVSSEQAIGSIMQGNGDGVVSLNIANSDKTA